MVPPITSDEFCETSGCFGDSANLHTTLERLKININSDAKKLVDTNGDLKKHQRFLRIAKVTSLRSKDPNTQVGCVIVDKDNCIVSVGYNGFPIGVDDDVFRWDKEDPEDNKHLYVVHAEMNAIINKVSFII